MRARFLVFGLAAAILLSASAAHADDPCLPIAKAFLLQSAQPRMAENRTEQLSDGEDQRYRLFETESTRYEMDGIRPWATSTSTVSDRKDARLADQVIKDMALANCKIGRNAANLQNPQDSMTIYKFTSNLPGTETSAELWIDDATGLPVQMTGTGPAMRNRVIGVSASFVYGDTVNVPEEAQGADTARRLKELQRGNQPQATSPH